MVDLVRFNSVFRLNRHKYCGRGLGICLFVLSNIMFGSVPTVFAEDLDVFLRADQVPSAVRPNILFVVDAPQVADSNSHVSDAAVRTILANAVEQLSGVNVGLVGIDVTADGQSSAVLSPLLPIESVSGRADLTEPVLRTGADDVSAFMGAEHIESQASVLHLGSGQVPTMEQHEITVPVSGRIGQSVERVSNGRFLGMPANFEFDGVTRLGLRFDDLGIPSNAVIKAAHLTFVADAPGTGDVTFAVSMVPGQGSYPFSQQRGGLAARSTTPMSSTEWHIASDWHEGDVYQSPDIAGLVQDEVDKVQWSAQRGLVLLLDHLAGSSDRSIFLAPDVGLPKPVEPAETVDAGAVTVTNTDLVSNEQPNTEVGKPAQAIVKQGAVSDQPNIQANGNLASPEKHWAPQLVIQYETPTGPPVDKPKIVGLRFSDVPIPQGAKVTRARLDFHAAEDAEGQANYKVRLQPAADAAAFAAGESVADFVSRAQGAEPMDWVVNASWAKEQLVSGPDVTALVQNHVSANGAWCGNNAMTFFIEPADASSTRVIYSHEHDQALQAKLHLEYEAGAGCMNEYYSARADKKNSDAKIDDPKAANSNSINLQFDTLPIAQGAKVLDAQLLWHEKSDSQGVGSVVSVQGQGVEGADLSSVISAVIEQSTWRAGQALTVTLNVELGDADVQSHLLSSGMLPSLRLKVSDGGLDFAQNTVRRDLISTINSLPAESSVPQAQVYFDAAQYFQGVHDDSAQPIQHHCQANHMIFLTQADDGALSPVVREKFLNLFEGGDDFCADEASTDCKPLGLVDVVAQLAGEDQSGSVSGMNTIETHALKIEQYADIGALQNAITGILNRITATPTTFTQPGITVNNFNRLSHQDAVFYSVFQPGDTASWSGNLKRFQVAGDPPMLVDSAQNEALDADKGFFHVDAKSVWSTNTDGADVALGGAASVLASDPSARKIYTFIADDKNESDSLGLELENLHEDNSEISAAMLGAEDAQMRNAILQWARGVDVKDWDGDGDRAEFRQQLGAPIHSVPALATYGGSEKAPDITVFFGTHDGKFHAVDAKTGAEYFAFVPESFLPLLKNRYIDETIEAHAYGVDGSPTLWVYDANGDQQIEVGTDHVYVYFGLRRGGRDYFALDVTDRNAPKLLWHIQGGSPEFANLGQSWAQPVKTKVDINGEQKDVLLLSGGFDPVADESDASAETLETSRLGRAIYMVDARTGERLWWGSHGEPAVENSHETEVPTFSDARFTHAIPSSVSVVDVNGDDLMDQMYVGDLGGQVWRFDVRNGNDKDTLVSGGVIAQLSGEDVPDARQFFFPPQLALLNRKGAPTLGLVIGSGAINKPLSKLTQDRIYVLFQKDVFAAAQESIKPITSEDLADYTAGVSGGSGVVASDSGWYINLSDAGEKVLSAPLVVNNNVLVSTYSPVSPDQASCQAVVGQGRVYLVGLEDAKPVTDLDGSGDIDLADRSRPLKSLGIPPTPVVLFSQSSQQPLVMVGAELPLRDVNLGLEADWQTVYWYE